MYRPGAATSRVVLALLLTTSACAPRIPGSRVHPGLLDDPPRPMPRRVAAAVADFPVGISLVDFHIVDPDPTDSRRAADAMRAALERAVREHPLFELAEGCDPPPDAWRERCAELVLEILRDRWAPPELWTAESGPPTLEASLGDELQDWGLAKHIEALLVGWGESVLPQPLTSVVGAIDSGSDGFTTGMLQYVVLLVELSTGDVLWMAEEHRLLGGSSAVLFDDVRKSWIAERYVGLLLDELPGESED